VSELKREASFTTLLQVFLGSKKKELCTRDLDKLGGFGTGSKFADEEAELLISRLLVEGYLTECIVPNPINPSVYFKLGNRAAELKSDRKIYLDLPGAIDELGRPKAFGKTKRSITLS
jgi:hypothetical protein